MWVNYQENKQKWVCNYCIFNALWYHQIIKIYLFLDTFHADVDELSNKQEKMGL